MAVAFGSQAKAQQQGKRLAWIPNKTKHKGACSLNDGKTSAAILSTEGNDISLNVGLILKSSCRLSTMHSNHLAFHQQTTWGSEVWTVIPLVLLWEAESQNSPKNPL